MGMKSMALLGAMTLAVMGSGPGMGMTTSYKRRPLKKVTGNYRPFEIEPPLPKGHTYGSLPFTVIAHNKEISGVIQYTYPPKNNKSKVNRMNARFKEVEAYLYYTTLADLIKFDQFIIKEAPTEVQPE